jgi:hypothetical protein
VEPDGVTSHQDQSESERLASARGRLLALGAGELDRRPWQAEPIPHSSIDLIQWFLWSSKTSAEPKDAAVAALQLLSAARAELDQIETALMFEARFAQLSWTRIADAIGLDSRQAAQQRLRRLTGN